MPTNNTKEKIGVYPYKEEAKRLHQIFNKAGISPKYISDLLGYNDSKQQSVRKWLSGERKIPEKKARILADLLGIRVEYILCEDDILNDYSKNTIDAFARWHEKSMNLLAMRTRIENVCRLYNLPEINADDNYWNNFVMYLDSTISDAITRYFSIIQPAQSDRQHSFEEYLHPVYAVDDIDVIEDVNDLPEEERKELLEFEFNYDWEHNNKSSKGE